ncbi:N-formyl peptide receptor 3-like [Leptodactylus fuscus]|uniref:N-formyl peptide receptor 3-like n=1 Tax=Leptodactylus fuscus TaxID=238119 RepID=UPI003F4EAE5F
MVPADSVLTLLNITEDDYNWSYYTEYEPRDTTYDYYENILEKISLTLKIIIFVLGIIGNGLVIWIAGFRMKKTISAVWFLHLAIADFLFCAGLSLNVALELQIFLFTPKVDLFCLLYIIMFTLNMSASILLLTAMSIDRCVSVMWPFWAKVHRTRRLVRITAGGIWGLSLLITSLIYYIHRWCLISGDYIDSLFRRSLSENIDLIRLVIMFVIPFLIILTSYLIIFLRLRKSKRPQRSQRLYRIITAVILCFFICWFPISIWLLIRRGYIIFFQSHPIDIIAANLPYLNSCLNPIIYVFMGQNIKPYFFRSIPARIESAMSEHPEDKNREPEDLELQ